MILCDRCKMLKRSVEATHVWTSPLTYIESRHDRFTQNLCNSCYDYDKDRSKLVQKAVEASDRKNGGSCVFKTEKEHVQWVNRWNRTYHQTMNKMTEGL